MRRVISAAVVAAGTLALCLLVPPWVRQVAILLAAVYACREAIRMAGAIQAPGNGSEVSDSGRVPPAGLAATVVLMLLVAGFGISSGPSAVPLAAMALPCDRRARPAGHAADAGLAWGRGARRPVDRFSHGGAARPDLG